jgi:transcriptional regulator with XRE-family HTH domain
VEAGEDWTDIGRRIRGAREGAGLSVRELARRIGVSPSHISQVERGLGSYSVATLYAVTSQLAISLDSLFATPRPSRPPADVPPSALDGAEVLRFEARPAIKLASGPRWERLTSAPDPDAEFLEVTYEPSPPGPEAEFSRHDGVEYGVVIAGHLSVQVGFEATVLRPGDAIRIDSMQPHRYWNAGTEPVRAIWFESRGSGAHARDIGFSDTEQTR